MNDNEIIDSYLRVLIDDFLPKVQNKVDASHSRRVGNLERNISDYLNSKEKGFKYFSRKRKMEDVENQKKKLIDLKNSRSPKIELRKDGLNIWIYILSDFSTDYINTLTRSNTGSLGEGLWQSSFNLRSLEDEIRISIKSSPELKTLSDHLSASIIPRLGDFFYFSRWSRQDEDYLKRLVKSENLILLGVIKLCQYYNVPHVMLEVMMDIKNYKFENNPTEIDNVYELKFYSTWQVKEFRDLMERRGQFLYENMCHIRGEYAYRPFWRRNEVTVPIIARFDSLSNSVTYEVDTVKSKLVCAPWRINFQVTKNYFRHADTASNPEHGVTMFINGEIIKEDAQSRPEEVTKVAFFPKFFPDTRLIDGEDIIMFISLFDVIPLFNDPNNWKHLFYFHSTVAAKMIEIHD